MTRLEQTFASLRARGERALVAYVTGGDPSLELTGRLMAEVARRGADVLELGVPFSDPVADGPVIQRATQRALAAGASLLRILELVRTVRSDVPVPIVLLTYYNPVLAFGLRAFAETAVKAGVDGLIVADLPPEEAQPLAAETELVDLDLIHLVAPTSTPERMRTIARCSRGFVYLVSLAGVTGERAALPSALAAQVRTLRGLTTKPVCVGFGIGRPEQVAAVGRIADGVIVGSAIVRLIEERASFASLVADVGDFVDALKAPLRDPGPDGATSATRSSTPAVTSGQTHDPHPPEDSGLGSASPSAPRLSEEVPTYGSTSHPGAGAAGPGASRLLQRGAAPGSGRGRSR